MSSWQPRKDLHHPPEPGQGCRGDSSPDPEDLCLIPELSYTNFTPDNFARDSGRFPSTALGSERGTQGGKHLWGLQSIPRCSIKQPQSLRSFSALITQKSPNVLPVLVSVSSLWRITSLSFSSEGATVDSLFALCTGLGDVRLQDKAGTALLDEDNVIFNKHFSIFTFIQELSASQRNLQQIIFEFRLSHGGKTTLSRNLLPALCWTKNHPGFISCSRAFR